MVISQIQQLDLFLELLVVYNLLDKYIGIL